MDGVVEVFGEGFPVVVWGASGDRDFVRNVVSELSRGYRAFVGENAEYEEVLGWSKVLPVVFDVFGSFPIVLEYPVLGGPERIDVIVVGRRRALVIEGKYWSDDVRRVNHFVLVGGEKRIDPCYQLENYVSKLRYLHSASRRFEFDGAVFFDGAMYRDGCKIMLNRESLSLWLDWLDEPGDRDSVSEIVNGRFEISKELIRFISENKEALLKGAVDTLLGGGYGLTEEQLVVVGDVMDSLEAGEDKAFIVKGVSGSGKTLVALTLFFEALSMGYKTLLTYRNNRLLNTIRKSLGDISVALGRRRERLSGLIRFYSMGPQGRYRGVAEKNFPIDKYGFLDLVIYDEAQRMTYENINVSMRRSKVKVYFYDDDQVLIGDESGVRESFIEAASTNKVPYKEYTFSSPRRIPASYLISVNELLEGRGFNPGGFDFRVYDDIQEMLKRLGELRDRGHRVALVAAFTETPGRKKAKTPDNLRIGYPLCMRYNTKEGKCLKYSDLDIYKGLDIEIYWLMDEKNEYPQYWMGKLDPLKYCASVYGAQGFEAEYVGVIWGRDLIWRDGWRVNPNPITDNIGNAVSLASLARKDPKQALKLLKNRYLILLTRGTKGVYVFFEDKDTGEFIKSLLRG